MRQPGLGSWDLFVFCLVSTWHLNRKRQELVSPEVTFSSMGLTPSPSLHNPPQHRCKVKTPEDVLIQMQPGCFHGDREAKG